MREKEGEREKGKDSNTYARERKTLGECMCVSERTMGVCVVECYLERGAPW